MAKLHLTAILITISIYCCVFANVSSTVPIYHILSTYFFTFLYLQGICSNIYGPTWLDLTALLETTLSKMSLSISIRAMFFCAGAIIGGFIYRFLNRGALYPLLILTKGLCVALIPLYAKYNAFLCFSAIIGLVSGAADTSVNVWILDIWGDKSAPFVQALQFFWALGFIVSPLISNPFLSKNDQQVAKNMTFVNNVANTTEFSVKHETIDQSLAPKSLLHVPYGIAGALCLIGSISLLAIYLFKTLSKLFSSNPEAAIAKKEAKKQAAAAAAAAELCPELESRLEFTKKKAYLFQILAYTCVMTSVFCASEMTTFQYIPTYCVKLSLGLTKSTGSLIMTGVAISFAIGRFVGIFCALRFKPQHILWFDWLVILIGNWILVYSNSGLSQLWTGSLFIGFGYASFFAAVFSFLRERIVVNNLISSIVILSSLSGNAFGFPVLIGKYIDQTPLVMIFGNLFCLFIMFLCFIGLIVMDCKYGVRSNIVAEYKKNSQPMPEKSPLNQ